MVLKNFYKLLLGNTQTGVSDNGFSMLAKDNGWYMGGTVKGTLYGRSTYNCLFLGEQTQNLTYDMYTMTGSHTGYTSQQTAMTKTTDGNGNDIFTQTLTFRNQTSAAQTYRSYGFTITDAEYSYNTGSIFLFIDNFDEPITIQPNQTLSITFEFKIGGNS